jgi:hypothetical protein
MSNPHIPLEPEHMPGMKDVSHKTVIFPHTKTMAVTGDYSSCILSAVLQNSQPVI